LVLKRREGRVRRRDFIKSIGGAAIAWPLAAPAQQSAKPPTIGYLGAATPATQGQLAAAFVQRLRELGWNEGRNLAIEYRWAEGRRERYAEIAAEFVRRNVDVIVTSGDAAMTAKQATSVIPIIFAVAADPVGAGLVASLAQPGGNVTGLSTQFSDTGSKKLELLHEAVPGLRRLAILGNVGYPASVIEMNDVQAAARTLGLEVITLEIRRAEDIAPAFITLKDRAGAQGRATGRPPDSGTNQVQLRDQPQDRQGHLVGDREQSDWDVKTESVRS
jgi:putative tryptophan/tyrosine transport system substrate-binding protein